MGRITKTTYSDGTSLTNEYYATGHLKRRTGSRAYPVEYTYDPQGRMTTMITWQNYADDSGKANTSWQYNSKRGFLTKKLYDDPDSYILYTNTPAGRLSSRQWARGILTTYAQNTAGENTVINYSDGSTPSVTNYLDRLGRVTNIVDGAGSRYISHADDGRILSVTNATGILRGLNVDYDYDALLRRSDIAFFTNAASVVFNHTYTYDDASGLSGVSDGTYAAAYSYLANSSLIDSINYKDGLNTRMTAPRTYDHLGRRQRFSATPTSGLGWSFDYTYNQANQRVQAAHRDGSAWHYDYDRLGQLTSGRKHWGDGSPVAGQQREYAYDDIGNRLSTAEGGDTLGAGLRLGSYGPNLLNQYTNRTAPEALDVIGIANALADTTVNGQTATRKGEYYRRELPIDNASGPDYVAITNQAVLAGQTNTTSGHLLVGPAEESFTYDADGNLLTDGLWDYTWDGENRLIEMKSDAAVATEAVKWLVFAYDSQGRRISKTVSNWNSGWSLEAERKYAYDDWNLLAELDGDANLLRSFLWGTDLSGSMQGAGGVGGLVAVKDSAEGCHFAAYDGNGNVVGLVDATDGSPSADYEYDPFGQRVRYSGAAARINPFQFSTKYLDDETGFSYYGHRFYNPSTGRWLSRDPIGERGVANPFAFVGNDPIAKIDLFGLSTWIEPVATDPTCEKRCGVHIFEFRNYSSMFNPGGWTLLPDYSAPFGFFFLNYDMEAFARFRALSPYTSLCCRYIQLAQVNSASIAGTPVTKASNGAPIDGNLHLDPPSTWVNDNISANIDVWGEIPHGIDTRTWPDSPGFPSLAAGTLINFDVIIIGLMKDICRTDEESGEYITVASTSIHITANGPIGPNISVSPGTLYERTF